ncbi:UNVERIFIED_CONTAM: hypothetical protein Cloal_3674 [Acetivibrio alkalicellulosi]
MELLNKENGEHICTSLKTAYTFCSRLKGLMFTKDLPKGHGLHIKPCNSIHTFFMKYPLDVIYLDGNDKIVALDQNVLPGRIGKYHKNAVSVVELPVGTIKKAKVEVGQFIIIKKEELITCKQ